MTDKQPPKTNKQTKLMNLEDSGVVIVTWTPFGVKYFYGPL